VNTTQASKLQFRTASDTGSQPIRYAIGHSSQGALLVARSDIGICAIFLADNADLLLDQLTQSFEGSKLEHADQALRADLEQVAAFIDNGDADVQLDLAVDGSDFQRRVWNTLRDIPSGRTLSYKQVAQKMGAPGSARAVASACAANKLAVVIPCHRVIRGDGSVSGYRWGVDRKRRLLDKESAQ
jgi:AraC family transcriptional regulator, regulatory protein of adaptative response / methylated-DNA-[protein]-cysteine methyltransferase